MEWLIEYNFDSIRPYTITYYASCILQGLRALKQLYSKTLMRVPGSWI